MPFASPSRPLSDAQVRALLALIDLCADLGCEVEMRAIAEVAGLKPGATTLALGGLRNRRFAEAHGSRPQVWSPTFSGRELARRLPRPEADKRLGPREGAGGSGLETSDDQS